MVRARSSAVLFVSGSRQRGEELGKPGAPPAPRGAGGGGEGGGVGGGLREPHLPPLGFPSLLRPFLFLWGLRFSLALVLGPGL